MDRGLDGDSIEVSTYRNRGNSEFPEEKNSDFRHFGRVIALWILPIIFLAIFYFYPLGNILWLSFTSTTVGIAAPFIEAFKSATVKHVLWFTIWQAIVSTILTLIVGLPGAYILARFDFRGKSLLKALTGIPFVLPTLVVAAAFNAILGSRGWFNILLMRWFHYANPPINFTNTIIAIFVAHVFYNTTIVLRMVGDFWSHLDPHLEHSARTLGANRIRTFRNITLPLLMPAIASAALLVFIFDFTSFGVILVLGGPKFATLEVEIYYQTINLFNLPLAAILSALQLACTLVLTVIYSRLAVRLSRPIKLKSTGYTQRPFNSLRMRLFATLIISLLLILLISPLLGLALRSVTRLTAERGQRGPVSQGLTLEFYRELSINRQESLFYVPPTTAIGISLAYALTTVVLSLGLGLPASWSLARGSQRDHGFTSAFNRILDPILMLPLGTSAVTLGLGFIVTLDHPPFDLRASPILVPLAHTLVAFPFVVRSLTPALRSIQPRLRSAAALLGASPGNVLRFIDLPLVGRAVLVAAIFAFTISLGEFGATSLVARPEYPTIPLAIYRYLSLPGALNYGQALALSTILMIVTGGGMLAIERFRIADVGEF
jgi:thiamine transport system permease protein